MSEHYAQATLGGGCFWCLEAVFLRLRGVQSVVSGYSGGHLQHPDYQAICNGNSGHAEVVQVSFDPQQLSYAELLEVFFAIHDPTTLNRQGNDIGPQYRSVIFYHDETQHATAIDALRSLQAAGLFDAPIVTEVTALSRFWPGEAYHQRYYDQHPAQPYCAAVISPKLAKFRRKFADKLQDA